MKKMMMAAVFAAIAAAAFGWLPENCMIRDRLCGEDASGRLCGKFDISCTEQLFDIMRTNTAEIVRIENALYPAPKYDRIMPMEGETKHLRKGLDAAFAQLFDDFRSFIRLQRQYKLHLERLSDNTVSNVIERRDLTWEELRLGETRGLTDRYSIFVGEISTSLGQPARRINAIDVDKYMSDVRIPKLSIRPPAKLDDALLYLQMSSAPLDFSGRIVLFALSPLEDGQTYPDIPELEATDISLHDALRLVLDCAKARYYIRAEDGVVVVVPNGRVCEDGGVVHVLQHGEWPRAEERGERAKNADTINERSNP